MRFFKDRLFITVAAGLLSLFLFSAISSSALAAQYKLYINKQQSASNVVVFDDSMSATVVHTSEGMELTLPGVEVALRCKSSSGASNTTDSCVIAIEPGTTTSSGGSTSGGSTSGGSTSGGSTSGGSTSGGDCVVTTWNNCGGSSSGGSTSGGSTSGGTSSGGSGACSPSSRLQCGSLDYGSGGNDSTGKTTRLELDPGVTLALPFSVAPGANYGQIAIVPTSFGLPDDGAGVRMWWSAEAGGKPLANAWCSRNIGFEGSGYWVQSGKISYGCPIPDAAGKYFVNLQLCISDRSDTSCSAPGAKPGSESAYIYIQGNEA